MPSQRRRSQRLSQASRRQDSKSRAQQVSARAQPLLAPLLRSFPLHSISEVKRLPHRSDFHLLAVVVSIGDVNTRHCKDGTVRELSCICLGDDSCRYFQLTLWANRLHWREAMGLGDVVLFKHLRVTRWRGVTRAEHTWTSRMTIVQRRAVLSKEEEKNGRGRPLSQQSRLHLSCAAPQWMQPSVDKLSSWLNSQQSGFLYLHSPHAHAHRPGGPTNDLPLLSSPAPVVDPATLPRLSVSQLLSPTLASASYRVRCRIHRIAFPSLPFFSPSPSLRMCEVPPLSSLASLVYRGCPHCSRELHADGSGVFRSVCAACVALDESRIMASDDATVHPTTAGTFFYRPFHVLVNSCSREEEEEGGGMEMEGATAGGGVWLSVPHAVACRLLVNLPASMWAEAALRIADSSGEGGGSQLDRVEEGGRRRSKRLRSSTRKELREEVDSAGENEVTQAMAEAAQAEAEAEDALCARRDEAERVLDRFCAHPRCQCLQLLCAVVNEEEKEVEEEDSGRGACDAPCELTLFVDVQLSVDDNDEVESRRISVVGCSLLL